MEISFFKCKQNILMGREKGKKNKEFEQTKLAINKTNRHFSCL
jgi:hypothetical protein